MGRATAVYGPYNTWATQKHILPGQGEDASSSTIMQRMSDFLKISKTCSNSDQTGCVKMGSIKDLNQETGGSLRPSGLSLNIATGEGVILSDGTGVWCFPLSNDSSKYTYITVDIDGPNKGTNTYGKDIFEFTIDSDTGDIFPFGYDAYTNGSKTDIVNNQCKTGRYAAAWIIQNDNADYLKADSSCKCPNGVELINNITCN